MKKLAILAAALFATGAARVQAQTPPLIKPTPPRIKVAQGFVFNPLPAQTAPTAPTTNLSSYSQDSYISQSGTRSVATVTQTDSRGSTSDGGSSATVTQSGDNNTATQTQKLVTTVFSNLPLSASPTPRNTISIDQAGLSNTATQDQTGGGYNVMTVIQGAGTDNNTAKQTQSVLSLIATSTVGDKNSATISQVNGSTGTASHNYSEQNQSGVLQTAEINQNGTYGYAKQDQPGINGVETKNSATINQGVSSGTSTTGNTAIQFQGSMLNTADIKQSVTTSGISNYASQSQIGQGNTAKIVQNSSGNTAYQEQPGNSNDSTIDQSVVSSLAHTIQSGTSNTAFVTQH